MRVVIDARMIRHTGIGRYIGALLRHLPLARGAPELTALTNGGVLEGPVRTKKAALPIPVYSFMEQVALPLELRRLGADIVHCPSFNVPIASVPEVVTIHDLHYLAPGALEGPFSRAYARAAFRAASRARSIIAVSEHTRREAARVLGVDPDKVRVIYNGVDDAFRRPVSEAEAEKVLRRYALDGEYILAIGHHGHNKNLKRLIRAYSGSAASRRVLLAIGGRTDPRRGGLYAMPEALGLKDRVRFLGEVEEADLLPLYSRAALFVYPSISEGFGLPLLEAMAAGAPVACSNAASLPEVAADAAAAFDPLDAMDMRSAIDEVIGSPALRQELREKGLARSRLFDWSRTAEATLEVYREALR